jgi:hypothetical protein
MNYQLLNDTILRQGQTNFHPWPDFRITGLRVDIPSRLFRLLHTDETMAMLWRAKIPRELLQAIGQFPDTELERLLHLSQLDINAVLDWASFCPALLVLSPDWQEEDALSAIEAIGHIRKGWRHVLEAAGWPVSHSTLRILRKVSGFYCSPKQLGIIRQALRCPRKRRALRHLGQINSGVIDLLSLPDEFLNPSLLQVVAALPATPGNLSEICLDVEALRSEMNLYPAWPFQSGRLNPAILRRHRNKLESQVAHKLADEKLKLPPPPMEGICARDFQIEPISTIRGIFREGAEMKNCSASYVRLVAQGTHYLYRLLRPERATVLFIRRPEDWYPIQAKSYENGAVQESTLRALHTFAGTLPIELENTDDFPF